MRAVAENPESNEARMDKGWLQIEGHLLRLGGKLLQINNIERVTYWIEELPPRPDVDNLRESGQTMRNRGFAACGIGIALLFVSYVSAKIPAVGNALSSFFALIALAGLIGGGYMIWLGIQRIADADNQIQAWEKQYNDAKNERYLYVHLVSGKRYAIQFERKQDLLDARRTLAEVFKNGGRASQEYHLDNVNIFDIDTAGNVITGDNAQLGNTQVS